MNKQHSCVPCLAPVRVRGTVTRLENGAILLKNSDENGPYHEMILHLRKTTPVVDAVSGLPLARELRDGETVCAWVGPAMTLSLPPHATSEVVVANNRADFGAPRYYELAAASRTGGTPVREAVLTTACGEKLTVARDVRLMPWRTRQIVTLDDLVPGSRVLVWRRADGGISRVLLFPYG